MALTNSDLQQIGKVVNKAIDTRVPKIVDERIKASVPQMIEKGIQKTVPGMIRAEIKANVPQIVDERIRASVPKIADAHAQGVIQELSNRIDELMAELDEKINHLPTKDEFYESEAKLMKEIGDLRDEVTANSYRTRVNSELLKKHRKRIKKLETRVSLVAS